MPKKRTGYEWRLNRPPPPLDEHSKAKHQVVHAYLDRYLRVMLADPRRPHMKLHVVDGFCGGGLYSDTQTGTPVAGSPFVVADALGEVMASIAQTRRKPPTLDVRLWLVDSDPNAIQYLNASLMTRPMPPFVNPTVIHSKFEEALPGILGEMCPTARARPRAIFLLDQYGYLDATYKQIRTIFGRVRGAEVLLTLSTDALLNYLTEDEHSRIRLQSVGLRPAEVEYVLGAPLDTPENRALLSKYLTVAIARESGAAYYTPFFIRSRVSNRSYLLVHLSNQVRARNEMVEVHWDVTNHSIHYGRPGLHMMGFDPLHDVGTQLSLFEFDDVAAERTHDALLEELPRTDAFEGEGVLHGGLIDSVCNETPATIKQINTALVSLQELGEISIQTPAGSRRQKPGGISADDRIVRPRQMRFLLP